MQEHEEEVREPMPLSEGSTNGRADDGMWSALGTIFRWRVFIAGFTGLVAVGAIVVALLLPNWYAASVRVLPPEASAGNPLASALLRGTSSAASALLGGVTSDYARYLAILSSRRVLDSVVEEFDLIRAYNLEDSQYPHEYAVAEFRENVSFPVDDEYEFLSVVVFDKDPQRAADIANFMVRQLNAINSELSSQNAANYREFVEGRYEEARVALDSVLDATQAFQRQYGVVDLDVQSQAYFSQLASLEANATLAEVQYESQLAQLGPENPEVQALRAVAQAAQEKVQAMLNGSEAVLPVPRGSMSNVARAYADLQREFAVQTRILEVIGPMYEQARFEEEKTVEAVQIVDRAVPPPIKAKPQRSVLVVVSTITGFLLAILFVLSYDWWQRRYLYISRRLRTSVERGAPRRKKAPVPH
jgi:capsule polysaccharide export protein KpsE/RkpR